MFRLQSSRWRSYFVLCLQMRDEVEGTSALDISPEMRGYSVKHSFKWLPCQNITLGSNCSHLCCSLMLGRKQVSCMSTANLEWVSKNLYVTWIMYMVDLFVHSRLKFHCSFIQIRQHEIADSPLKYTLLKASWKPSAFHQATSPAMALFTTLFYIHSFESSKTVMERTLWRCTETMN